MSWIQELHETYNNCQSMIGIIHSGNEVPLLPVCHTTQKAHVEITLDGEGNFRRARVVPRDEARTIIPCTERSGGRTSGEAAHPLCDKLQYIAADYRRYGGSKKPYFASYVSQLESWCGSECSSPKLLAVLNYVKKGHIIEDLVSHQIFLVGEDGKLLPKWEKKKGEAVPKIFEVIAAQEDAFIRWEVELLGERETKLWLDKDLWELWIRYYSATKKEKSLCYVVGDIEPTAEQHPAKIRNDADKAKLISSNDTSGFTFRGRFFCAGEAASVGFEVTQKAHSALRWLINRQGYIKGDLAIVAWSINGEKIPNPMDDPISILLDDVSSTDLVADTAQSLAIRFNKRISGYGKELGDTSTIVVLGLDSATPGRMAIIYYRKLTGSDFLRRITDWHETCAWLHRYRMIEVPNIDGKGKFRRIAFIGAPAPNDITEAVYGSRVDDKLRKATIARILPCIIDGQPIPRDLVESSVRRASNRIAMDYREWDKTLSIACALFRKYSRKENYSMALDPDRKTRDYLYGRLLALAESLEEWALNKAGEDRPTNAARLMQRFSEHPYTTWKTIEIALAPYKARLGGRSKKRQRIIDEVVSSFKPEDFLSDRKLSGEFLLGYHNQREALRNSAISSEEIEVDENE